MTVSDRTSEGNKSKCHHDLGDGSYQKKAKQGNIKDLNTKLPQKLVTVTSKLGELLVFLIVNM